ncbi:E3 ubiquitin-protein ligase MARCH2-like isoform X2 [Leptotrombidium deliense]|uniref:E3 ubiquitin-protein ligase MARCH2-like isoform X2 n=1 Tax=Leptotrombidium deliense TaxID=299467 RepID=A0A443SP68_9ACAR|nr:E3 ubiquitin-protein ligase MARCH2-like isoform X2 [Leptotrombidium deliense]
MEAIITNVHCCRICYESTPIDDLIAPCKCKGSVGYVHEACLVRWYLINRVNKCDLCCSSLNIVKKLRPCNEVSFVLIYHPEVM